MTHTKGPWTVKYADSGLYVGQDNGSAGHIARLTPPASVYDARLIAAAPELLEACENALEVELEAYPEGTTLSAILQKAINKAKGE